MSFLEAVKSVFSQYVGFSGRARRSEYWYFVLFNIIVSVILNVIAQMADISFLPGIWSLAILLPSLAVCMRRLHDIGKSGWWVLLSLIPVVGQIILIIWYCKDSMPGDNQYGPNPKDTFYM